MTATVNQRCRVPECAAQDRSSTERVNLPTGWFRSPEPWIESSGYFFQDGRAIVRLLLAVRYIWDNASLGDAGALGNLLLGQTEMFTTGSQKVGLFIDDQFDDFVGG
ncbi:hypothetical protein DESC_340012 [Desulfosarcina cetonica]|uniref:hypothetical protein n=1 Tax=Desulfosarcina cetonica TaxID=90730 RepID=UPI0012ED0303|nr:hypothetical protein [Desulfosarcina cetonica]VTR65489.1 hypothetical protein DESC_340012 [Desulfosarcina cetonica]